MPTTIDLENAKQIRQPMDVIISMEIPDEGTTLTFSGYTSSAKVADGVLSHQDWPMRQLADLQEDGFPLDGSRVLYDPNTSASASNGKIGVRGNIGAPVTITVTGNRTIASLSIFATGASSVTYNGTTSQIAGGQVIIPVGATSITLTFNPVGTTTRVEVSDIIPGTVLNITNDTLIKAVVSLRSDLSIIDPTLPESELNVEVYNDADISEVVASLPEDSPITYRAGYDNDLSPERKFYVAGQVTWADNVLSIHAVDAVHFLEVDVPPMWIGTYNYMSISDLCYYPTLWLDNLGIVPKQDEYYYVYGPDGEIPERLLIPRGNTIRQLIAYFMNIVRLRNIERYCPAGYDQWVFTYVDAGIPEFRFQDIEPAGSVIYEEDCADVGKQIEPPISKITVNYKTAGQVGNGLRTPYVGISVGSAQMVKGVGVSLDLDDLTYAYMVGLPNDREYSIDWDPEFVPLAPTDTSGEIQVGWPFFLPGTVFAENGRGPDSQPLLDGETSNGELVGALELDSNVYAQIIPWNARYDNSWGAYPWRTMLATWNGLTRMGLIKDDASYYDLNVYGYKMYTEEKKAVYSSGQPGAEVDINLPVDGQIFFSTARDGSKSAEAYPEGCFKSLFSRSNITGSFTWKGDPRMQPRDVVNFHRLDGTVEEITLENITITHEGGGTSAEITYRKGIV